MKKLLVTLTLLIPLGASAQVAVFAQDDYNHRTVSTNGFGEVQTKPDMAELNLNVTATRSEALAAKQEVDNRVNKFLSAIKKFKLADDDIVASTLRTNPRYEYDRAASQQRFAGYDAARILQITVRKLDQLTEIMDIALGQEIQGIQNIAYKSSKEDELRAQVQRLAIEDSKARAKALAQAYGAELGPILRINYQNQTPVFGVREEFMTRANALSAAQDQAPGVYLPDMLTFRDNIQVVFDLIINP